MIHAAEQDRPDVAQRRTEWRVRQLGLDPDRLVFLDEFGANTKLTLTHDRAPVGQRLVAKVPHGPWKSTTFLMGLRRSGLIAPLAIDGALNGDLFVAYVQQQLVPALQPGDIMILDNLSSYKRVEAPTTIEASGCQLWFLPPDSPDLNPIEQAISKVKRKLRDAEERTVDGLWQRFSQLLDTVSSSECHADLNHSGDRDTKSL